MWGAIASAVVGAGTSLAGGIYSRYQQREQIRDQAEEERDRLAEQKANLQNELSQSKENAKQKVTQNMEQTYLSQLEAESQYMDAKAQGSASIGTLDAKTSAGGIQQGTTIQQVSRANIQKSLSTQRQVIDKSLSSAVQNVNDTRRSFKAGSAYMNVYQGKIEGINAADKRAKETIESTEYGKIPSWAIVGAAFDPLVGSILGLASKGKARGSDWFLADLFNAGTAGSNFVSSGEQNNWWRN